mgnify:CR=1 FL=1
MRGENGIRPGSSLPPALRATSLAEGGRGLRPQTVGERTFRSHNVKRESHYALL